MEWDSEVTRSGPPHLAIDDKHWTIVDLHTASEPRVLSHSYSPFETGTEVPYVDELLRCLNARTGPSYS